MSRNKQLGPAEWLSLIAERAPALREAGVESIALGEVSITLAKWEPPLVEPEPRDSAPEIDPLDDLHTYGRTSGALPGYPFSHELTNDEADQ